VEYLITFVHDDTGVIRMPLSSRWQWVVSNVLFLAVLCALGGPGMATSKEPLALGILAAVCFLGPMRAGSALLEWYLVRQHRHRAIVVSHMVGLGIGAMLGTSPSSAANPSGEQPITGLALGVFGYILAALIGLCIGAALAFLRARRRGGTPATPDIGGGWSLSLLPALFWFNAVFIVAVGLLIAPSMAAQENSSLTYGFTGGLIIGVMLRLPGAWAEWWLTKHLRHRAVYGVHVVAGLLTAFVVAVAILSPTPDTSSTTADTVGTAIGVYLFLSSLFLAVMVAVFASMQYLRRGRDHAMRAPVVPPVIPQQAVSSPTVPVVYRATARVPEPLPPAAPGDSGEQTVEVVPRSAALPVAPTEPAMRATSTLGHVTARVAANGVSQAVQQRSTATDRTEPDRECPVATV
jgi:hypothetical protein